MTSILIPIDSLQDYQTAKQALCMRSSIQQDAKTWEVIDSYFINSDGKWEPWFPGAHAPMTCDIKNAIVLLCGKILTITERENFTREPHEVVAPENLSKFIIP